MHLGAFSISLPVQDIAASKDFYEALGFEVVGGDINQNWLILRSGTTNIGLFQGMFDQPMLSFNPGWDQEAQPLESFIDVRDIQAALIAKGIEPTKEAESGSGPASLVLTDPDGHPILIDQHVSALK